MNVLIVEGSSDKYFIEMLLKHQKNTNLKPENIVTSSLTELTAAITDIMERAEVNGLKNLGIMIDMDDETTEKRLGLVNKALQKVITKSELSIQEKPKIYKINKPIILTLEGNINVKIFTYFVNINGKGELEDVLKAIASKPSPFADGLEGWIKSIGKTIAKRGEQGDISEKELRKLWLDFYKRFDTLKKNKRNKDTTNWQIICLGSEKIEARGPKIFNLNHPLLNELDIFLSLFGETK